MSPAVGGSRPVMHRAAVDLPEPDSPTTATVRPRWMSNETSFQHLDRAVGALTPFTEITGVSPGAAGGFCSRWKLRTAHSDLV